MTVLDGFIPSSRFKEEYHEPMSFEHVISSNSHHKPRRQQMLLKPVEDYRYYVALVLAEDGSIQLRSSQDMKPYKRVVLEEAVHKFNEVMSDYIQQPDIVQQTVRPHLSVLATLCFPQPSRKPVKRRHPGAFNGINQPFFVPSERKVDAKQSPQSGRQLQIRVDDRKAQEKWFSDAFKAVQQVGCRTIAKVWIKKIHPKKQSTHPYNGGFPRDQQADPDRTRPPYWPANVIHKEPDHIDRSARTALLVHLIMNTPQPQIKSPQDSDTMITAHDLLLALEEKKNDFKLDRWSIISEIINARGQFEMFESGGFDEDTIVHVPDFSDRPGRGDGDGDGDDTDFAAAEPMSAGGASEDRQEEENAPTPMASTAASPSRVLHNDKPQVSQHHQNAASNDAHRDVVGSSPTHPLTNTFQSATNNFSKVSSEGNCSAIVVDTHPFVGELKRDPSNHRLQQLRMPHDVSEFQHASNRHQQDLLAQHWIESESPTSYVPPGYCLDHMHAQAHISPQHFRMSDAGMMQGGLQELTMSSGLPMLDGIQFEEFPPHSTAQPVRAMSTPHPMMLDHGMHGGHGLGVVQQSFYAS